MATFETEKTEYGARSRDARVVNTELRRVFGDRHFLMRWSPRAGGRRRVLAGAEDCSVIRSSKTVRS